MSKETITIEVPKEVAQAYEEASPSDRQRVKRAVTVSLMSREDAANRFREITERASKHAAKRGLTPEKLDELLAVDAFPRGRPTAARRPLEKPTKGPFLPSQLVNMPLLPGYI